MPGVITDSEVQGWLDTTKIQVSSADYDELEDVARTQVYASIGALGVDTTTWTTAAATPELVRKVVAMLTASWLYARLYSEDVNGVPAYSVWLESRANGLIASLIAGDIDIDGSTTTAASSGPVFYPTDASTLLEDSGEADADYDTGKFSMGRVF